MANLKSIMINHFAKSTKSKNFTKILKNLNHNSSNPLSVINYRKTFNRFQNLITRMNPTVRLFPLMMNQKFQKLKQDILAKNEFHQIY